MLMEALIIMTVIGLLLLLTVRISSNRREKINAEEMRKSTEIMKKELERSGSAIISRIGSHVNKLERLIREAQAENKRLLSQMDEATNLRDSLRELVVEARTARQQLAEERRAALLPPPYVPAATPEIVSAPVAPVGFDEILQNTLQKTAPGTPSPKANNFNDDDSTDGEDEYEEEMYDETEYEDEPADEDRPSGEDAAAARETARDMLMKGMSVEETARETGLGKGALELMRKMIKR